MKWNLLKNVVSKSNCIMLPTTKRITLVISASGQELLIVLLEKPG